MFSVIAVLVLFFPIPSGAYRDGGTREYTALTYKLIKWNKLTSDGVYRATRIYPFPNNTASVDELWAKEALNLTAENEKEKTDVPVTEERAEENAAGSKISDNTEFSVYVKDFSFEGDFPYIKIGFNNRSSRKLSFGDVFDILYRKGMKKSMEGISKSCFTEEVAFNDILYIVAPGGSTDHIYGLGQADLSKDGYYRLESLCSLDSNSAGSAAEWYLFGVEFSVKDGKPGNIEAFSCQCTVDPVAPAHYHDPAEEPRTVEDPVSGYCGNLVTTVYKDGKSFSFMYGESVHITDILVNLDYERDGVCSCAAEFAVDTELIRNCEINLTEYFVRCEKGQASLTKEQADGIKKIIDGLSLCKLSKKPA